MKKLLFVLALGAFAACGTSETPAETTGDTATVVAPAMPDTTAVMPDTTVAMPDTSAAK